MYLFVPYPPPNLRHKSPIVESFFLFLQAVICIFLIPLFLAGMGVWVCVGLGVRVPHGSLFHDEKLAFFDFEVRGTPKILKIFLGVPPKILKKDAPHARSRCVARSDLLHTGRQNPHFFQNFRRNP